MIKRELLFNPTDIAPLLELMRHPEAQTFRLEFPDGTIREFDGLVTSGTEGEEYNGVTYSAGVEIVGLVREGSIFDPEGAD